MNSDGITWVKMLITEKNKLIEDFLADLNKIQKVIDGGFPKANVYSEIFESRKKWEGKLKE